VQTLELFALDRGLEAEVEVGQRLHRREPGRAHGGLQPPGIAELDVGTEGLFERFPSRELARVTAP
jgi:hypothetical protein